MHKHFRMLAISEHLRNHGFDPDACPHTRIPGIWAKLGEFYNLEAIDERENNMDPPEEEGQPRRYHDFTLPWDQYGDMLLKRARADPSEAPTSPAQWDPEAPPTAGDSKKRKRGRAGSNPRTRSSTVEDTEGDTPAASPTRKSGRGGRATAKRTSSRARKVKEESSPSPSSAEESEEEEDSDNEEEEEEEEDTGTPVSTRGRGGGRGRGGRGRGRGRGRRGR